jgi:ribonuclease D
VRNRRASEVDLPRGTLLSNAVMLEIATARPSSLEELSSVEGMRPWRLELLGSEFLDLIRATG